MSNPFSKDYKSQIDTVAISRDAKTSRIRTQSRQKGLTSDDPDVRRRSTGTLGGLSSKGLSPVFKKDAGSKKCKA